MNEYRRTKTPVRILLPVFLAFCLVQLSERGAAAAQDAGEPYRIITDMRGKAVRIPARPERVATIDDGFVEGVMTHLGVIERVSAVGSWGLKRDYRYRFETASGETYEHRGWNTMKFLHPWLDDLPCFNSPQGNVLNFEILAASRPDLVILRAGDCTVGEGDREKLNRTIETIEALELPLVVLNAPGYYRRADISTLRDEMYVIGEIFGQPEKALALADYLRRTENMIRERTKDAGEAEKSSLLYLGLNPNPDKNGSVGTVYGLNTPESYLIENVAGAKNAFSGQGYGVPLSAEQIYALDPDVIVLPTYNGYHPPRELYEAACFANLAELRAVKNKKVRAMPWTPMNCARRVEYPLDMLVIAKAAYPERFKDIDVYAFALRFYQDVYGVDESAARGLRSTQLLDWMADDGF